MQKKECNQSVFCHVNINVKQLINDVNLRSIQLFFLACNAFPLHLSHVLIQSVRFKAERMKFCKSFNEDRVKDRNLSQQDTRISVYKQTSDFSKMSTIARY